MNNSIFYVCEDCVVAPLTIILTTSNICVSIYYEKYNTRVANRWTELSKAEPQRLINHYGLLLQG